MAKPTGTSFDGVLLDSTSLIVAHALLGDANIDSAVNFDDLLVLAQHYGQAANWLGGDFDYDGVAIFDDLLSIAQNYGSAALVTESFESDWNLARSLAPEPACAITLAAILFNLRRSLQRS